MYRFLLVLALCGLLAHATAIPSSRSTTTDRYVTAEPKTTKTDSGLGSYTDALEALNKAREWFKKIYAQVKDKFSGEEKVGPSPLYEDLCTADVPFGYEARSFNTSVWVSVVMVNGSSDNALWHVTTKLEEYFNGKNDRGLTTEMTTPIRMTYPRPTTLLPGVNDENTVTRYSLYLPPEWHENPPMPLDGEVVVHREQAKRYFVKRFPSFISTHRFHRLLIMEDLLNQRKEQFVDDQFFTNVYDRSSNRPDEVMVLVKPSVVNPACKVTLSDLQLVELRAPDYVDLCKDSKNYEARLYFRAAWVSTTVNSESPQQAESTALPLLDKYFNRYNNYGALIPKTEPVRLTIAWPASTSMPGTTQDYTFSYFVPFDPAHSIPQPLDDDVVVLDELASTIFASNFRTLSFDPYKIEKLQELRDNLDAEQENYVISDSVALQLYHSKSYWGVYHYNEALVRMDPSVKQPKCVKDSIPPCYHRGKHCPSYRIIETFNDNIEHRVIAGSLYVMKRTQTCIMDEAYSAAYMSLHRYFYGQNSKQEMMNRTTPIILVHKSTHNPPAGCDFSYNLLFYLPPDQHLDPPKPIEGSGIELTKRESKETYVITFSNSTTEEVVAAKEEELRTELDKRGICYSTDEFFIATYDAPWRKGTRRFEIWIPKGMCMTTTMSVNGLGHNMVGRRET